MKSLRTYIIEAKSKKVQPETKDELAELILKEIDKHGLNCDLNHIDTSKITDMSDLFSIDDACFGLGEFNGNISEWNVTNVKYMTAMFWGSHFNGDISNWNVSNVVDMDGMFFNSKFENNLSKWEIKPSCNTDGMFDSCSIKEEYKPQKEYNGFPKDYSELSKTVKQLIKKYGNKADLNCINTSRITDMSELFYNSNFNGDISKWDVSNVEDMSAMFYGSKFNGDISNWNVGKVKDIHAMFWKSKFNGDISKWNVSNVTDMTDVFAYSNFNGDISKWNTGNVIRMTGMFRGTKFNGDISKWNIHNVKFMNIMFTDSEFDGDISSWNIKNVKDTTMMFDDCPIKKEHKPGYVKLSELEKNIKNNNKAAIKDFIMNLLTNHGNKTANEYTLNFGYLVRRFWNSVPEGFSYIKSKDKLYIKMYWQGDKTDGYEMLTFDEVWGGDFNFYVHTGEKMLSEKDTFIEVLKALDKKYK